MVRKSRPWVQTRHWRQLVRRCWQGWPRARHPRSLIVLAGQPVGVRPQRTARRWQSRFRKNRRSRRRKEKRAATARRVSQLARQLRCPKSRHHPAAAPAVAPAAGLHCHHSRSRHPPQGWVPPVRVPALVQVLATQPPCHPRNDPWLQRLRRLAQRALRHRRLPRSRHREAPVLDQRSPLRWWLLVQTRHRYSRSRRAPPLTTQAREPQGLTQPRQTLCWHLPRSRQKVQAPQVPSGQSCWTRPRTHPLEQPAPQPARESAQRQ